MKKPRFTADQIIGILQLLAAGQTITELARAHGVTENRINTWMRRYGGMNVGEAQRLNNLEKENRRLKQLVADLTLHKEVLKAMVYQRGWSSHCNGHIHDADPTA